jgi:hypothetical protein
MFLERKSKHTEDDPPDNLDADWNLVAGRPVDVFAGEVENVSN